jgi:8-oxo-dGTP pyrophosphatase MutT (NUDIX family)
MLMNKYQLVVKALIKKDDSFLILKTKESGTWETPGGNVEKGEDFLD